MQKEGPARGAIEGAEETLLECTEGSEVDAIVSGLCCDHTMGVGTGTG